ncbi:hypothetical protein FHS27_005461 [Rhodopirellula rubra]|uniref:Uncharacterized protein n=1 Tax=Aporhodopirellula rubra TaxID=980271 RepID=A0A7W5E3P0_9BACT|nr:hypothetical protein [Aporhodopirellula rubra]MBB3209621.1 hypothetical protein [Aporhodopirellula rubra]
MNRPKTDAGNAPLKRASYQEIPLQRQFRQLFAEKNRDGGGTMRGLDADPPN